MPRRITYLIILLTLLALVATPAALAVEPAGRATSTPTPAVTPVGALTEAKVIRVIDGDTIEVQIGRQQFTVRYISVDTPETVHPSKPVQYFGKAASLMNKQLVEGKTVRLEKDVSETDKYDRLLRYVWVGDTMINAELVRLGFAQVASYPPDVRYLYLFLNLQREARSAGRGLWVECTALKNANLRAGPGTTFAVVGGVKAGQVLDVMARTASGDWLQLSDGSWIAAFLVSDAPEVAVVSVRPAVPTAVATPRTRATAVAVATAVPAPAVQSTDCDPSYPDVCIPSPPPDLDCGEISYRRFRVIGSDPHRFDGDHDGIGCEK